MEIIKIQNLTKIFKKKALDNFSLNIKKGEILGLVGNNGAGKSTLIKIILGLLNPTSGKVEIMNLKSQKFGYVPERFNDKLQVNSMKFLKHFAKLSGFYESEDIKICEQLLNDFTLSPTKNLSEFSKGMRQKLLIAQAVVNKPDILILDEPTEGLDPSSRITFYKLLKTLNDKNNTTIILSSHILSEIEKICNRIVIINKGKLQENIENNSECNEKKFYIEVDSSLFDQIKNTEFSDFLINTTTLSFSDQVGLVNFLQFCNTQNISIKSIDTEKIRTEQYLSN